MSKTLFTAEAEQDLRQIVDYIAQDSVAAALSWLKETQEVCDLLSRQPAIGQPMQTARFGEVRRHVAGNYLIYYLPGETEIRVVRIVHGARDQRRLI